MGQTARLECGRSKQRPYTGPGVGALLAAPAACCARLEPSWNGPGSGRRGTV